MPIGKRPPSIPPKGFEWFRHVSKADLMDALHDIACTCTEEGCDDVEAGIDEAAALVKETIERDGRKPHKSILAAAARRGTR